MGCWRDERECFLRFPNVEKHPTCMVDYPIPTGNLSGNCFVKQLQENNGKICIKSRTRSHFNFSCRIAPIKALRGLDMYFFVGRHYFDKVYLYWMSTNTHYKLFYLKVSRTTYYPIFPLEEIQTTCRKSVVFGRVESTSSRQTERILVTLLETSVSINCELYFSILQIA